jgi:predicted nucleotidyltransferase
MQDQPQDLVKTIRALKDPIRARGAIGLYLYGSRQRGDFRHDSDLDIFVEYDPSSDFSIVELSGIKRLLEEALGLDVHITTRRGLNPAFRAKVESTAVKVL